MKYFFSLSFLFTIQIAVHAELIVFDYSDAPIASSIIANDGEQATGRLYFSTNGVSASSGDLQINLTANTDKKGRLYGASVELGIGFALVMENDVIDLNSVFTPQPEGLIAVTGKSQSAVYSDYLTLRFTNNNGDHFYGWAEVIAQVDIPANGKKSTANFSVSRFAFQSTADQEIIVGAIPEPAVASLIIGSGLSLLVTRRIFMKS